MIFKTTSAGSRFYTYEGRSTNKQGIKNLEELGFEFETKTYYKAKTKGEWDYSIHALKDWSQEVDVEINDLDDLLQFIAKYGNVVVASDSSMIIYNDYLE